MKELISHSNNASPKCCIIFPVHRVQTALPHLYDVPTSAVNSDEVTINRFDNFTEIGTFLAVVTAALLHVPHFYNFCHNDRSCKSKAVGLRSPQLAPSLVWIGRGSLATHLFH